MPTPTITNLNPASATAGSVGFTLTVNGTNFGSDVVVNWGTLPLATIHVSATQATATVPESLIADAGGTLITARTGGASSNATPFLLTTPLDLITVMQVRAWTSSSGAPSLNTSDDPNIQAAISGFSLGFLNSTGAAGPTPLQSPFVEPVDYDEWYNGNGNDQLFLKHGPIIAVASVTGEGVGIPSSDSARTAGWVIDQDRKSIVIRRSTLGAFPNTRLFGYGMYCFPRGRMNINVQYTAGYTATPADIVYCATVAVAQNWRRNTENLDKESQQLTMGGTLKFRSWVMPPDCLNIVRNYTRTSFA